MRNAFPAETGIDNLIRSERAIDAAFVTDPAWCNQAYVDRYKAAGRAAFAAEPAGTFPRALVAVAASPTAYAAAVALHDREQADAAEDTARAADVQTLLASLTA